ncbi:hypothetical protein DL93DRAFT_1476538 [Clavulina sp. PMI_390]|nr:hypothetical protein DL93DRAFT_1476538 [Clavulina sp. PMI_390]
MSEGFQIEIPSLDEDDDFATTPIPFGRPQNFQFGQNAFSSSPNMGGPLGEVSAQNWGFNGSPADTFHARGDSYTSEPSGFGHPKPNSSFSATKSSSSGHTTSLSNVTSHSSPHPPTPARKSSFASIKNAFKTGKLTSTPDIPPVPSLDSHAGLRNPFNRGASSRTVTPAQSSTSVPPVPRRRPSAPGASFSFQNTRSATPVAHARGVSNLSGPGVPGRKNSRGGLTHSPASSINHSDADHSTSLPFGSPPLPRVPNASASFHRPAPSFISEAAPEVEPSTPAEYALNVVLTHFVTNAERSLDSLLRSRLVRMVHLDSYLDAC